MRQAWAEALPTPLAWLQTNNSLRWNSICNLTCFEMTWKILCFGIERVHGHFPRKKECNVATEVMKNIQFNPYVTIWFVAKVISDSCRRRTWKLENSSGQIVFAQSDFAYCEELWEITLKIVMSSALHKRPIMHRLVLFFSVLSGWKLCLYTRLSHFFPSRHHIFLLCSLFPSVSFFWVEAPTLQTWRLLFSSSWSYIVQYLMVKTSTVIASFMLQPCCITWLYFPSHSCTLL